MKLQLDAIGPVQFGPSTRFRLKRDRRASELWGARLVWSEGARVRLAGYSPVAEDQESRKLCCWLRLNGSPTAAPLRFRLSLVQTTRGNALRWRVIDVVAGARCGVAVLPRGHRPGSI